MRVKIANDIVYVSIMLKMILISPPEPVKVAQVSLG